MNTHLSKLAAALLTTLLVVLPASYALAGGYQLNLLGQRQIAMGHVGTGLPLDLATIAQNPGGLSMLHSNGVLLGSNATFINTTYRAPAPSTYIAKTDSDLRTPFSLYASVDTPVRNLRAGLAVYTPYGNSLRWEEGWRYRFMLREISLTAIFVQPTLSYKINDRIGVGAGLIYAYGAVNLQRDIPVNMPDGSYGLVDLDGTTSAVGYNLGLSARLTDAITFGAAYRSRIDMQVSGGDADFTVPASLAANFPAGNTFDAMLPLPAVLSFGLGLQATDRLRMGLEGNLTFWSAYESLEFSFAENTATVQDISDPRNFNDRWIFRIGGEFDATDRLQLRLGSYYDPSPVDEGFITPETPDVDRIGLSGGFGYAFSPGFGINASVLVVTSSLREQSEQSTIQAGTAGRVPVGEFKTLAVIPGLSVYRTF